MKTPGSTFSEISALYPGDHLCCIYETEEEHQALLTPYMRLGLERNEKVIYIVDARTAETVMGYLRQDGLDPLPFIEKGQLVLLTVSESYLRDGAFDPERMISLLRQETDRAVAEGYGALRVTGEMSWALKGPPGSDQLIEYESKLNRFFPGSRCLSICQYDRRRFPPGLLLQVLASHPIAVIGTEVFQNHHYILPEDMLTLDFEASALRHWIDGLRIRKKAKEAEIEISRANRLYEFTSQINQMAVRVREQDTIFAESCRIAIEHGKFRMAWIGLIDEVEQTVRPVAWNGFDEGYLTKIKISTGDVLEGRGPTGTAIRERKYFCCNDYANDPRVAPWRDEALQRGYYSSIALSIIVQDKVIGAFSIYASEPNFFNESEIRLLEEVTGNIAYALEMLEREKRRKQAENARRESEDKFRDVFESANVGKSITLPTGEIFVNEAFSALLGYSQEELRNKAWQELTPADEIGTIQAILVPLLNGEKDSARFEKRYIHKNGSHVWADVSVAIRRDGDGKPLHFITTIIDIAERKRSEEALSESEQRFRGALENIPDVVVIYDRDLRIRYINAATRQITGRPTSDFIGKRDEEIWPPEVYQVYLPTLREALNTREICSLENDILLPGSGLRNLNITCVPLLDENNKVREVLGITRDFTERKRAEESLRASEERFSNAFHVGPAGITITRIADGKFIDANESFCRMFEFNREEVVGHTSTELYIWTPEERKKLIQEQLASGGLQDFELQARSKSGRVMNILFSSRPMELEGEPHHLTTMIDITERKRAEEKLQESESKYRLLIENATEGIFIVQDGVIKFPNPVTLRVTGYSVEELASTTFINLVHPEDREMVGETVKRRFQGEEVPSRYSFRIRNKVGEVIWVQMSATMITWEGRPAALDFVRDITEQKILESQLVTAQKMETVGTLAGGIAHDFNNALTGIVGFGELLRTRVAGDKQALHDLDEIMRCAERAATLTRQLLTYARRQVIEPVNLSLNTLATDLMKLIRKVVGEHIEINHIPAKNLPTIWADRGQIEQVLMNLCLNARDAMPEGGKLLVETRDEYLDDGYVRHHPYMRVGRYVLLRVSDTGVGMDEKTRERVFEPFFTTKGPDKGTGLGLAMVYGIVKQHDGFIHLYSEPGKGTTFTVYFPAVEALPDAVPGKPREEVVRGGTETILLAEDEEPIRVLAERILKGLGYDVLVARDGEEAIEIFRRNKGIALVVLDAIMPRKGGKEAYAEMQKENPRLKGIFMSGYSADAIHESFVLSSGIPFLQKPFGPTILARKIREALDTPG